MDVTITVDTPVRALPGAGPMRAKQLEEAGLATAGDLIYYLPYRYEDRRHPVRIIRKYSKRLREANTLLERLVGREVDSEHGALDATQNAPAEVHHRHRLVDLTTGAEFFFSKGDETTIGRADPVTGILPDIDLTSVDANRSVSRRHAKIICSGNQYFMLEEVGTVNGTYVNDQRIPTGTPVMIHNGDGIKIGLIAMKAVFD